MDDQQALAMQAVEAAGAMQKQIESIHEMLSDVTALIDAINVKLARQSLMHDELNQVCRTITDAVGALSNRVAAIEEGGNGDTGADWWKGGNGD